MLAASFLTAVGGFVRDEREEFVGQAQIEGVLAVGSPSSIGVDTPEGIGTGDARAAPKAVRRSAGPGLVQVAESVPGAVPASALASVGGTATLLSGDGSGHVPQE